MFDLLQHLAKHLERFPLVLLLRVFLRITAEADALPQIVHRGQVFLPVEVQLLQHHFLFYLPHELRANRFDLLVVGIPDNRDAVFANLVFVHTAVFADPARRIDMHPEITFECIRQPIGIPLLFKTARRDVLVDQFLDDFLADCRNRVCHLVGGHEFRPLVINDFSLIVRHIIVFEEVLSNIKVVRFDFPLRLLDLTRQDRTFDGLTFAHAHALQ